MDDIIMTMESQVCPKCNGCGTVIRKRASTQKSLDPTKKWCAHCKNFLDKKEDFYNLTGWCKKCHNSRRKIYNPEKGKIYNLKAKKYECICVICNINFFGYKNQIYCSRKCNCISLNGKKGYRMMHSLSNESKKKIMDEFKCV